MDYLKWVKGLIFLKNNAGKTVIELLIAHYGDFSQWYLSEEQYSLEHYNESFGLPNVLSFYRNNPKLPQDLSLIDNELLNDLLVEFVVNSWDTQQAFFEFFGAMMNRNHYEQSFAIAKATQDQEFITLWQYITQGRDFSTLSHRQKFFYDMSVGFLERDEYLLLQQKIEQYFGDIENLRKLNYVGLECMLQAISELTENNRQIISIIEL